MVNQYTCSTISIKDDNPNKVVIIGAGLAGLTAAYRLLQNGKNVEVYEARSRVGGRILTAKIKDQIVELGGQNITDGGESHNLLRLIKELNVGLTSGSVELNPFYFNGKEMISIEQLLTQKKFTPETIKNQLNHLARNAKNMREVLNGILREEEPLYKALAVRLAGYEGASIEKLSPLYTDTLYHMLLGGVAAVHTEHGQRENSINLLSMQGGNALLLEKIAQILGSRLHLNQPLKRISKNLDRSFALVFQNGRTVKANTLILAIPCSVYEDIVFEDNVLPLERLQAIKNVQYGTNSKILVPFSKPPAKRLGLFNDRVGCFFDVNCHSLTLYYTGLASYFSADTLLGTYQKDRAMIEIGFNETCPPFVPPLFAKDQAFINYEAPIGYSWPNDSYVKGSYSYIASGQESLLTAIKEDLGEPVKTLFAPIDQKLYFVGEHTSILMEAPGTMEAACESGERIARMILNSPYT